jgi:hypothetical protein
MSVILLLATLVLASVTIVSPLAGVHDDRGDVRLARERYVAVRGFYYPGFTFEGLAEPLAIVALSILLASIAGWTPEFCLIALALAAEAGAHLLYWALIVPMNRDWLAGETQAAERAALQDRWERSHIFRSIASTAAVALLAGSLLAPGPSVL